MKHFGLPKTCLLRKGKEFEQVYKRGKRLHGKGFSLIYYMNTFESNRLGISIHRQLKGAAKRNRIKRIIRESFRLNRQVYPLNADIVITVRPDFSMDSPDTITKAVSLLVSPVSKHPDSMR